MSDGTVELVLPGTTRRRCKCGTWFHNAIAPHLTECGRCRASQRHMERIIQANARDEYRLANELTDDEIRSVTTEEEQWWRFPYVNQPWR